MGLALDRFFPVYKERGSNPVSRVIFLEYNINASSLFCCVCYISFNWFTDCFKC